MKLIILTIITASLLTGCGFTLEYKDKKGQAVTVGFTKD